LAARTPTTDSDRGRIAQRRRTRKAIVAAAADLLARGISPSVADIADAADVSRRTVYMYFPTLEQLLVDAALASITRDTVERDLAKVDGVDDPELRAELMARAIQGHSSATEQQGRTLLRVTVDADRSGLAAGQPLRGYRRIEWIEQAMAPLRAPLGKRKFERLVSALAMIVGWEAMIVQRDIRALSPDEAEDLSAWCARAFVRASLDEAGEKHKPQARRRAIKQRT
jgi:AcrR family transcriptional regulator